MFQGLLPAWVHQSPPAPSPRLADFTQELCNLVTWESRHSDLGSLPARLAAPRRFECSSQLGGEPHPQVSVPETPPQGPAVAPDAAGNPSKVLGDWSPEGQPAWLLGDRCDPSSPSKQNSTRLQTSSSPNFRELLSSAVYTSRQRVRKRVDSKSHKAFIYNCPLQAPRDRIQGDWRRGRACCPLSTQGGPPRPSAAPEARDPETWQ